MLEKSYDIELVCIIPISKKKHLFPGNNGKGTIITIIIPLKAQNKNEKGNKKILLSALYFLSHHALWDFCFSFVGIK